MRLLEFLQFLSALKADTRIAGPQSRAWYMCVFADKCRKKGFKCALQEFKDCVPDEGALEADTRIMGP